MLILSVAEGQGDDIVLSILIQVNLSEDLYNSCYLVMSCSLY